MLRQRLFSAFAPIESLEQWLTPTRPIKLDVKTSNVVVTRFGRPLEFLRGGERQRCLEAEYDAQGGLWVSFRFEKKKAQHDIRLGEVLPGSRLLCLSRIKRWWQAPSFGSSADDVPVETQLLLVELNRRGTTSEGVVISSGSEDDDFANKVYAVVVPLIDFDRGFRVTLFGKEGGAPAGGGQLAVRAESGDPEVTTSFVKDALYMATGGDPYALLATAYESIAARMGTFNTRAGKPLPDHIDSFGFCTWDAFYSSVDGEKVKRGVQTLIDAGAPPNFVIIDDGWQSTGNRHGEWMPPALVEGVAPAAARGSGKKNGAEDEAERLTPSSAVRDVKPPEGDLSGEIITADSFAVESVSEPWNLAAAVTRMGTAFYRDFVETARPDSLGVRVWELLSSTVIRDQLLDFFATRTDFTKRLTSVRANTKFEDARRGTSLKGLVTELKSNMGVRRVFAWHALGGYWGGVSEDTSGNDELSGVLAMWSAPSITTDTDTDAAPLGPVDTTGKMSQSTTGAGEGAPGVERVYPAPTPHLLWIEPALAWDPSSLAGSGAVKPEKLSMFYEEMHAYLAEAGVDGVKVDAQSGIGAFGKGVGGGAALTARCVTAVEESVKRYFPRASALSFAKMSPGRSRFNVRGTLKRLLFWSVRAPFEVDKPQEAFALTGCMCHSTESLFNFKETSMVRASDDFYPRDAASQTVHLASCAYNGLMLGEIANVDWDMFHSKHPRAAMHAAARAVSGGAIYVSDAPGEHDPELLRRLVLPGGATLRAALPGRPTVDCLFRDVMRDGVTALKVWTRNPNGGGVVGVFNTQGAYWSRDRRKYMERDGPRPTVNAHVRPLLVPDFAPAASTLLSGMLSQEQAGARSPMAVAGEVVRFLRDEAQAVARGLLPSKLREHLEWKRHTKNKGNPAWRRGGTEQAYIAWSAHERRLTFLNSRIDGVRVQLAPYDWDVISLQRVETASLGHRVVKWAPIGLLNMLNAGGGVGYMSQNLWPLRQRLRRRLAAAFNARGSGEFGVYASARPRQILVDGISGAFSYDAKERIVRFQIPTRSTQGALQSTRVVLRW